MKVALHSESSRRPPLRHEQAMQARLKPVSTDTPGNSCADRPSRLRAALMKVRGYTAVVSCMFLAQPSTDKPIWGCRRFCSDPCAQACSEARLLQLGALQAYCQPRLSAPAML